MWNPCSADPWEILSEANGDRLLQRHGGEIDILKKQFAARCRVWNPCSADFEKFHQKQVATDYSNVKEGNPMATVLAMQVNKACRTCVLQRVLQRGAATCSVLHVWRQCWQCRWMSLVTHMCCSVLQRVACCSVLQCVSRLNRRNPPPRGLLFGRFPNQEHAGKGPPSKQLEGGHCPSWGLLFLQVLG